MEKSVKFGGTPLSESDISVLQHHYQTIMSDVTLLIKLAAIAGKSLEGAYLDCQDRTIELGRELEKLKAQNWAAKTG